MAAWTLPRALVAAGGARCVFATVNVREMGYRGRHRARMVAVMNNSNDNQALWQIDGMHSAVGFRVRHMMVVNARGYFRELRGTVSYDAAQPERARVYVEIAAASLDTRCEPRDAHLRNADFFDVERYPIITFRSRGARVAPAGGLEITGDLTIRGTTREVTLLVAEIARPQRDHNGRLRIGASATATIRRSDFGITYNLVLEAGGIAISDEVALTFDMSLVQAEPAARRPAQATEHSTTIGS